jgi:hypothetical protein
MKKLRFALLLAALPLHCAGIAAAQTSALVIEGTATTICDTSCVADLQAQIDALEAQVAAINAVTLPIQQSDVTGLENRLGDLETGVAANTTAIGGKADANHTHTTAQVTGLDAALTTLTADVANRVVIAPEAGNAAMALWAGTDANYAAITPDPNTVYICIETANAASCPAP